MMRIREVSLWRALSPGGSLALVAAALLGSAGPTPAEQPGVEAAGSAIFKTYCASCHGNEAKGDGPVAQHLRTLPPDLSKLALRSKGQFEPEKLSRIIDGRDPVKGHGGPDMPVWGDAFKQSREGFSEESVKARIGALVDFLESIQQR